jgi:hypothetical protein
MALPFESIVDVNDVCLGVVGNDRSGTARRGASIRSSGYGNGSECRARTGN